MATAVEELLKKISEKFKLMDFTRDDTPRILQKGTLKALERQLKVIGNQIEESHDLRMQVQQLRVENGDEPNDIREWSLEIEGKIGSFEDSAEELERRIKQIRQQALQKARDEEEAIEEQRRQRRYEEEMRHEEAKLEVRKKLEETHEKSLKERKSEAKLPKLVITKFQGTHLDWQRFWNQFEAGIDKTDIVQVAKFSYLRELLIPEVRATIDGLPFTTEGYERAKNVLKSKYGKPSEVVNAHVQSVMSLQTIHGTQPKKVHKFYEKLLANIQAIETMGKLKEINGYVRLTLDKLPGIRADLVRTDDDWQEWDFTRMIEALRKWCERNPVPLDDRDMENTRGERGQYRSPRRERVFQAKQQEGRPRSCVYCDADDHKSIDCRDVTSVAERKKQLSVKKLCYNCTGARHRASDCRSKSNCQKCNGKHHTSICDREPTRQPNQIMLATGKGTVIYPVVVVKVDGVKCRALLDSGAGSSYASAELINLLGKRPIRKEYKRIDMMMHSTNQRIEIFEVSVSNLSGNFDLTIPVSKVDRAVLLSLPNPQYRDVIDQHRHLESVVMDDMDKKAELPIHMILGASEYASIKTHTKPRIGQPGEPVAELTAFGWTIMSPGAEARGSNVYLTRTSTADLEQLYSLDVLGLEDKPAGDQQSVYEEFQEQLTRSPEGWYETGLLWKNNGGSLQDNRNGSLRRLAGLVKKLQREPTLVDKYDEIIQDQLARGIVERASEEPKGKVFYLPHKPVIRESAESTKMRVVFDASARANEKSLSLNDCLETGPPLQNLLWSVLVRMRFKPVALCGDLKQAFLQVRIREGDRDSLRFHWIKNKDPSEVEVLRFTRVPFGLVQSPFLLGGTLEQHLENCKSKYPSEVEEIRKSLYVDDVLTGGETTDQTFELKETAITMFAEAQFELHKWHSNAPELETHSKLDQEEQSYAKERLGVKADETKMVGLAWNKSDDTLGVTFPKKAADGSKREILRFLASIFDPLGLVSPMTLLGKFVYRDTCDQHLPWDGQLPPEVLRKWKTFERNLPDMVEVPRSLAHFRESIGSIDLHTFGDTSGVGTAAAVYAVVNQESGANAGLITAKSRLAKKGLTIPRLELVSGHMAANLVENVKDALQGYPIRHVYGWLDSTVALHWIKGGGAYRQFVSNRVRQITAKDYIQWRHVSTDQNPADVGSRGRDVGKVPDIWWKGPSWLLKPEQWPDDRSTQPTEESEAEAKLVKEVLATTIEDKDNLDEILEKHGFWKTVRITTWMARYIYNCRSKRSQRVAGPLTTAETDGQIQFWIKRVQTRCNQTDQFKEDQLRLNLQKNERGLYECRGRIQGSYPIYLPPDAPLSEKILMDAHIQTLHGGVGLTMAFVRRNYWIPRLRQLTKKITRGCFGCKRFQVTAFSNPPPGNLPTDRTEGSVPFQVLGADYAGPIAYKLKPKKEGKAHILLFACSLTRAIHLELLPDQTTEGFIRSFKRFIARRGRPDKIYSDNGRSFVGAAGWLRKVMKDERVQNHLAHHNIRWQFNLSRAPWWGGQFERMVGIMKQALHKSVGRALLGWSELEEVLLDVEVTLNNRPLGYVEDDVQLPTLTPNALMFGQPNLLPEENAESIADADLRKRARYLRRCKDVLWSRWTGEYLKALRERHNLKHKAKEMTIRTGDVVLIKGDERNRGKWNIGIVTTLIKGRDGIVRAARLRAGRSYLERAVQLLYPMELSCDSAAEATPLQLNPDAREFWPRRRAAVAAAETIQRVAEDEATEF